jgi:hypothetical protein
MPLTRSHLAREFAASLAAAMPEDTLAQAVRRGAPTFDEAKETSAEITRRLQAFVRRREVDAAFGDPLFDWEGNSARTWAQSHSYDLLGTSAHPDAAILRPFTCALEFDREPTSEALSHLKAVLLKAAVHVLSGAYDACLLVYLLRSESTRATYTKDGSPHTARLIEHLRAQGMFITFVTP